MSFLFCSANEASLPAFLQHQRVQGTGGGVEVALREVEIASGFFQIVMA